MALAKWKVPAGSLLGGGLLNGGLSYLAADGFVPVTMIGGIDKIVTASSVSTLLAAAVTAASLMLTVWAIVVARAGELTANLANDVKEDILANIDRFLSGSYAWFLSFAAFTVCYIFVISFDDLIDVTRQSPDNPLHVVGLAGFALSLSDEVIAPTLFLVGTVLLLAGTFSTIQAVSGLLPRLTLAQANRKALGVTVEP